MSEQQDNNNTNNNQKSFRRHNGRNKRIKSIQTIAFNPTLPNAIKKELTYHQALSVWLRSRQLVREGAFHPHLISDAEKKEQIEECYRQRAEQRN